MKFRLLLCLVLMLCAATVAAQQSAEIKQRSLSSDGATVGFFNLEDGQTVPLVFVVRFSITGMGIAPAGVQIDNTGHHHLLIDVVELPEFNQPLPENPNILHFGNGQSETELELSEGTHTLQLVLADYAHIPHEPPVVSDVISINVSANAPPPGDASEN